MKTILVCVSATALWAAEPVPVHKANYELAEHWTSTKVGKLSLRHLRHAALAHRRSFLVQL